MQLPENKTCGDCVYGEHCFAMYAHKPTDTYCDFFPRRFHEKRADPVTTDCDVGVEA